jgi:hypothetical protein
VTAVLDRAQAIAEWRRAEARVYPSVMVNEALYRQYVTAVRAIAEELADIDDEDALVACYAEHPEVAREVVDRLDPSLRLVMDVEALRGAAFCHRHRELTREHGKRLARERLVQARQRGDAWVLLFDDVTPFGSHSLEMHVRTGRALHASSKLELDAPAPEYELEVVQLDPADGAWLLDKPPLLTTQRYARRDEWEARIVQARETFGRTD